MADLNDTFLTQPELVERILAFIDLKDRVRCMCVCKAWDTLGHEASGALLWENVACTPHSSAQMCKVLEWVRLRRQYIKRLSLDARGMHDLHQVLPVWGLMTPTFVYLNSQLVSLDFSLPGMVSLAGWPALLVHLRWLSVYALTVAVNDGLSSLKYLEYLHITTNVVEPQGAGDTVTFGQQSIPASLRELCLTDVQLATLPACLTAAAASLTRLTVSHNTSGQFGAEGATPGSIHGLGPLPSLTALVSLELQRCALAWLPAELSRLSGLQELGLDGSLGPAPAPLVQLSTLGALRMLSVQRCSILELDHNLQGMQHVHTLCVSGNPGFTLDGEHDWVGRLKQLDIGLMAAASNHQALGAMVQLEALCLCGGGEEEAGEVLATQELRALLRALRCLPKLHLIYFKGGAHRHVGATVGSLAAFVDFMRVHRGGQVRLRNMPPHQWHPYQDLHMTWNVVPLAGEA